MVKNAIVKDLFRYVIVNITVYITMAIYIIKYNTFVPKSSYCTKNLAYPIMSVLNLNFALSAVAFLAASASPSTTITGILLVPCDGFSPAIASVIEFTTVTVNVII